jgi:hypothetical protein
MPYANRPWPQDGVVTPITAADLLRDAVQTFEERTEVYQDSHYNHGQLLAALFPNGVTLTTPLDHTRWVTFNQIIGKLCRYAVNFPTGHRDSIHDMGVYSFILEAIDVRAHATDA